MKKFDFLEKEYKRLKLIVPPSLIFIISALMLHFKCFNELIIKYVFLGSGCWLIAVVVLTLIYDSKQKKL